MGFLLAVFAALGVVAGGALLGARPRWSTLALRWFVALGAGFLLAVAFLRMLPESLALLPTRAPLLMLGGYALTHLFEHALVPHFHFGEETHVDVVRGRSSVAAVVGLTIHSLFDGVSIAAGYHVSPLLGWLVFVAILLHKLPEGFTVASIVRAGGGTTGQALIAAATVGAACVVGAGVLAGRPEWAGYGLAVATGVTIYVAATDLVPEVNKEVGHHLAFMVLGGAAAYLLLSWLLGRLGIG